MIKPNNCELKMQLYLYQCGKEEINERLEWLVNNSVEFRKLLKLG